ncbi:hypothetical protein [Anaerosolibacter sp.]|uniref:hypothetical protein n=1 Tax=Anaerosolibacter sp. TaxID=1872527 RepID=UPI0039EE6E2C
MNIALDQDIKSIKDRARQENWTPDYINFQVTFCRIQHQILERMIQGKIPIEKEVKSS